MAIIPATWTNAGLELITQRLAGITGSLGLISTFKVGEGGWQLTAAGKVPRTPNPALTDLDCIVNPGLYPADSQAFFQKALGLADIVWVGPGTISCTCVLDFAEFNDDGFGNFPEIYEIGIFVGATMIGYATFPVEIKTPAVELPNIVTLGMSLEC
jgi:hypothetical protein